MNAYLVVRTDPFCHRMVSQTLSAVIAAPSPQAARRIAHKELSDGLPRFSTVWLDDKTKVELVGSTVWEQGVILAETVRW